MHALPYESCRKHHSETPVQASRIEVPRRSTVSTDVRNNGEIAYPVSVKVSPAELRFAEEAGDRFEQAFALCSFASELVGEG